MHTFFMMDSYYLYLFWFLGLPPPPPFAFSNASINGDPINRSGPRKHDPNGVDINKRSKKMGVGIIVVVALSSAIGAVICVGAVWITLLKCKNRSMNLSCGRAHPWIICHENIRYIFDQTLFSLLSCCWKGIEGFSSILAFEISVTWGHIPKGRKCASMPPQILKTWKLHWKHLTAFPFEGNSRKHKRGHFLEKWNVSLL